MQFRIAGYLSRYETEKFQEDFIFVEFPGETCKSGSMELLMK